MDWMTSYARLLCDHVVNITEGDKVAVFPHARNNRFLEILKVEIESRSATFQNIEDAEIPVTTMIKDRWMSLHLLGGEFRIRLANSAALHALSNKLQHHWCIAIFPDQAWANKLFPDKTEKAAYDSLVEVVREILLLDCEDPVHEWNEIDKNLSRRARLLNELPPRTAFTVKSPGHEFTIKLAANSIWKGGRKTFHDLMKGWTNFPCGEIFTTPDFHTAEGKLPITTPIEYDNQLYEEVLFRFESGKLVSQECLNGNLPATFFPDTGAYQIGELALVGEDSPCAGYDFYKHTLPDEKRRSHIALGNGYKHCFRGADSLSAEQLLALGFNQSKAHFDVMWGGPEVSVIAHTPDGQLISVLNGFEWAEWLR